MILMRFRLLVSAILIALVHCISPVTVFAQSSEGWLSDDATANVPAIQVAGFSGSGQQMTVDGAPSFPPPSPAPGSFVVTGFAGSSSAPDEITPEIAALTQGVINGPGSASAYVKCFLFVTNQIEYEHYYGCKKGALLTYLERKGGDADLATLLVAMLRSAGYTARYGYGVVGLPTVSDPNGITAQNWLGTAAGSSTAASVNTMSGYSFQRGFPAFYRTTAYDGCFLHRVWVEVNVGGATWVQLDPALKKRVRLSPAVDVTAASGYDRTVLKTAAGGTITSTSVDGMDYAALSAYLTERTSVMLGNLDSNYSGTDAVNLLGGWRQEPFLLGNGNQLFFPGSLQAALPGTWDAPQQFDALPASLLTNITLEVRSTASGTPVASYTMPMANLEGRRLSLTFTAADATGQAQLWLDDNLIAQEASAAIGTTVKLKITIDHPHNNSISPTLHDQFTAKDYFRGSRYALVYSFNPTSELLKARQQQLDLYRRSGLPDTTREVVTETLNVIGLTWLYQTELMKRVLGGKTNCDTTYHHGLGRVGQEEAYYIDMNLQFDGLFSLDGNSTLQTQVYNTVTYYLSAMEHGVLEQLQGAANPALSTVKLLRLSNQQAAGSRKTFYANSQASWNSIYPSLLQNYSQNDVNTLALAISQGGEVLVPQKGNITLNHWTGAGYVTRVTASGATTTVMGISGVLNGGFASIPGTVSIPAVTMFTNSNPIIINTAPIALPPTLTSEPIDLASGDYVFPTTDLTVGSGVPRGFSFARQYHGGRRLVNPAGLGYGWTHNWQVRATRRTAYEPALGIGGTALDVAAMLVAAQATLDLSSVATDAQHWTLANLVSHWLADQLQDNAVAISIGERSMQFTRRADGTWQSPGGITTTLAPNGSGWQVQERHGNSYNFDASGHLTSIADLWGKTLNVAYNGSDQVSTVTDAYARSLTFTYTGGKLASVADSTGRTVSFTYNGSGDLVVAGDPEGKADRFAYDGEHRITEIRNHDNQLVATNTYDSTGKLIEQASEGDATKKWKYYYFLNASVEVNPQGGQTTWYFDSRKRQIGQLDAIGRYGSTTYDGQDRVTQTTTPLGRTVMRAYDRNHNVTSMTDPDAKVTNYTYDAQLRLQTANDPLSHTATFTYNARHQPLTIANALGETITNTYNSTAGTLASAAPPGAPAATTFGYNVRDELITTSLPGGGTETIMRNLLGDPENVVDARGNTTTFTYNLRREPLTVTRPGGLVTTSSYDNQRHLASLTDARNNTINFSYASSGKLLTTTLPGGATITDTYDTRDWLASTTNPKLPAEAAQTGTFSYFANGLPSVQSDPLNRQTSFGYDADDRRIQVNDALNHLSSTAYNGRSLVTSNTDPLNHTSSNAYDNAGRRTTFTNRRSATFTFGYDNADRLLSTTTPGTRMTAQSYNARGLVGTITEPSTQQTTLTYDARGRVQTRADGTGTITYGYDNNSNVLTVVQSGVTITRTYDALNRVATYDDGRGHTLGYGYDNNGNLTSLTYEPGKVVTYAYDNRNRLTDITDWTGRHTVLTYDGAGRLLTTTRANGTVRTNTWDAASQLTAVMDKHTASGKPVMALKLGYDLAGRLTDKFEVPAWGSLPALPARPATYSLDNQLATFNGQNITSDLDGNITSAPAPNTFTPLASYAWNTRNQLASSPGGMSYAYDTEGLRTSYTQSGQTTNFVNDPHGPMSRVLWRVRPDGTRTFYIYGPILLYEIEETGNVARYYHYDHLGSTIALSNDSGQPVARANYSAYGILVQAQGTLNTPFLWQGAFGVQTDPAGLHHMRARYYHAYLGRFLNADPLGLAAGSNMYAYCNGNPITAMDPSGQNPLRAFFNWLDENDDSFYLPTDVPPPGRNTLLVADFVMGSGETIRFYGPNSPETQDMRNSPAGIKLKDKFYSGGMKSITNQAYSTRDAFVETILSPQTGNLSSTAAQVGGFAGASVVNNGNGTATFTIPNTVGMYSFAYHSLPDRAGTTGPMRNIYQTFQWNESIPPVPCKVR